FFHDDFDQKMGIHRSDPDFSLNFRLFPTGFEDVIILEAPPNTDYFAARAGPMSDCLATVPWPPAIVAPVMPYFLRISPTAAVPSDRSIGPRGEMRSVTYRMFPVTTWASRKPWTWGLGIL